MTNKILKITFQSIIALIALFFIAFLSNIILVEDIIAFLNITPESNSGMAVNNIFSELKIVTHNLFGLVFELVSS
jgi:hypothetical protein